LGAPDALRHVQLSPPSAYAQGPQDAPDAHGIHDRMFPCDPSLALM
jgi:hypothetical protein